MSDHRRFSNPAALSALACAIALALTACGGGSSNVRATPPPPVGSNFTGLLRLEVGNGRLDLMGVPPGGASFSTRRKA